MKQIFQKILASLDTHSKGYSARKLTALAVTISILIGNSLYYRYATTHDNWNQFTELKIVDWSVVLVCLGLTTWENLKGKKDEKKPEEAGPANP